MSKSECNVSSSSNQRVVSAAQMNVQHFECLNAILFISSCSYDLTWVLPHIRTVVALGFFFFFFLGPVGDVSVAFVIRRGGRYGGFQSC